MAKRIGAFVFATWQGLGTLAKSFYDAGVVTDVMVIRHGRRDEFGEQWYPGSTIIGDLRKQAPVMERFALEMDTMLFFETPFNWSVIPKCRAKGVKTVLMPMYECMHKELPYIPDMYLCPSLLDLEYYSDNSVFLPVPVAGVEWRQREKAELFVHNAGNGGMLGRNGTKEMLEAMWLVKSGAKLLLRSQEPLPKNTKVPKNVQVEIGTKPYKDLYTTGNVFVFPEKFNGLSLPLQEARAAGMLVMCGNRFPMNSWLPNEPLIPVASYRRSRIAAHLNEFDEAVIEPKAIAETIDRWYGENILTYSYQGKQWAEDNSWETLKPKYMEVL